MLAATSAQTSPQNGQKVLRYPFEVAETGFDPAQLSDLYSRIVTALLFEGLYRYDHLARPFKLKPYTADGMPEVSEDFRTWTVRVKRGIYFQDDAAFKVSAASSSRKIMCIHTSVFSIRAGNRQRSPP